MKKLSIAMLLLFFAGMQSLAAQNEEGTITAKVTPSVDGTGHIYLSNEAGKKGLRTEGGAEGRVKFEADYNGIGGVKVEIEGEINKAKSNAGAMHFGFGDNAYAYIHVLQAFGLDPKIFDVYLQSGRFNIAFDNAKDAGQSTWLADVDELTRDKKVNMQLDLKILDMITVRYGIGLAPAFTTSATGTDVGGLDMGFGLLFAKSFGAHKIEASAAYVVNLAPDSKKISTTKITTYAPKDFDQLGISAAYTGTFGSIVLMPFAAFRLKGLINKPKYSAYDSPEIAWSAGVKFQLKDAGNSYDLIGAGFDIGGSMRANLNTKTASITAAGVKKVFTTKADYILNNALGGFGLKVWSDGLKAIMGQNYLHAWARVRFDLNDPIVKIGGKDVVTRKGIIGSWAIGLEQYLVKVTNATVKLKAEFGMDDLAPYYYDGAAGKGHLKKAGTTTTMLKDPLYKTYIALGLDASFTSVFTAKVK